MGYEGRGVEALRYALDRVAFARHVAPAVGIKEFDGWQLDLLRSRSKRILINACRQSGKTTCVAVMALHRALHYPGSFVLLFSPSLDQSLEFFRVVSTIYRYLGEDTLADHESLRKTGLELSNGSRIEARPGSEKTARGRSANLLVIDEAARVDDELYRALRPMLLATRGDLIMLSTPWGKTGVFYREWTREDSTWERHFVPATEVKRFTAEQLAEERKQGERYFKRELLCQFAEAEGQVFSEELINRAIRMDIEPLFPEYDILRQEDLEEEEDREEGDSDLISSLWEAFND